MIPENFIKLELTASQKLKYLETYTKSLERKLGEANSYISELEDRLNEPDEVRQEKWLEYKKDLDRKNLLNEMSSLREKARQSQIDRDIYISKYYSLLKEINYGKAGKIREHLSED